MGEKFKELELMLEGQGDDLSIREHVQYPAYLEKSDSSRTPAPHEGAFFYCLVFPASYSQTGIQEGRRLKQHTVRI